MLTVEEKKKYTVDDYMMLAEGDSAQLINYDLVVLPSPVSSHQWICPKLAQIIFNFLESLGNDGFLAGSLDVKLDDGNVLRPDMLYVAEERKSEIIKEQNIEGAPDMVIEVLSPESAYYDLRQKYGIYELYGVKEYIVIDAIGFAVELYTIVNGRYQLHQKIKNPGKLHSVLLRGLTIDTSHLFKFN